MGGDEFLLVFSESSMTEVNQILYEICIRVKKSNKNNCKYNLSLSYGIFEYDKQVHIEIGINEIIKNADFKMYKNTIGKRGILSINM